MKLPPGTFLIADLSASGELQLKSEYRYEYLEQIPGAADMIGRFSGAIWRSPDEFEEPLGAGSSLRLRWWSSSDSSGIATLRSNDQLISLTLVCSGISEDQDRITLQAFQMHLLRELHDTGFEPAFALMHLEERPLAATINFQTPADVVDQHRAALADRCFAASYFRKLGLA